jgi:uncharacterized membrane protein
MSELVLALVAFVGTHFLLSHPLRAALSARLGGSGFQILYTVVALATLFWVYVAYAAAPRGVDLWPVGEGLWAVATLLMLIASILLAGSLIGNPAMPAPGANKAARQPARGVFAITRHPMMWSFAIWALVHALVAPYTASLVLTGFIAFLALVGSLGQDRKKSVVMGESWRDWSSRTSFFPFANQFSGRTPWPTAWPGRTAVLGGFAIWLLATYLHLMLGGPLAGIWIWWGS